MQPEHKDKGGGRARGDVDKDHTHMITREVTDKCKGKEGGTDRSMVSSLAYWRVL
jgi:hypothetical protein